MLQKSLTSAYFLFCLLERQSPNQKGNKKTKELKFIHN